MYLNTHPYTRILTPYLTSEYYVTEQGVEHIVTYDKTAIDEKKIQGDYLNQMYPLRNVRRFLGKNW